MNGTNTSTADLNAKVALVTGAANNVGAEVAVQLARQGAQVVLIDFDETSLTRVGKRCEQVAKNSNRWQSVNGKWVKVQRIMAIAADIGQEDECRRVINSVINMLGRIDLLVNNCSVETKNNIIDSNLMTVFDRVMTLELRSLILLTHLTVPHLEKTNGNIVNIFKTSELKPKPSLLANCMANSAAEMFTKCLSLELGPKKIRINSITYPYEEKDDSINGLEVNQQLMDEFVERLEKNNCLGRIFRTEDVANGVVYLASNSSNFLNGINLVVEGGADIL